MAVCWAGLPSTPGQGSADVGGLAVAVGVPGGGGAVADVELHGAGAAAEGVDAGVDAGCGGAAVVGFDLADAGQQLPGERGAGVGGLEVQAQIPRRNIRQREPARLDGRARRDAGRGGGRPRRQHDPGHRAADRGGRARDREARRGHPAEQGEDQQHGDHSPAGQLEAHAHGTAHLPLASRRTVTSAVSSRPSPRSARTRTRTSRLESLACWSGRTWRAPRCLRPAYQAAATSAGLVGLAGWAAGGAAPSGPAGGEVVELVVLVVLAPGGSAAGLSPCWYSSTTATPSATATTASR